MYTHLNVCKQMVDVKLLLLHSNTWNDLRFGLFNGISTFVGYSMPNLFSSKTSSDTF